MSELSEALGALRDDSLTTRRRSCCGMRVPDLAREGERNIGMDEPDGGSRRAGDGGAGADDAIADLRERGADDDRLQRLSGHPTSASP
jgi:hypothetical protein